MRYDRHIHNGSAGFKGALVDAGEGSWSGRQGPGVYGHILFNAGSQLIQAAGDPTGALLYHGNRVKDWLQALEGSDHAQYPSERAGNIAGKEVGGHLTKYFGGKMSEGELRNRLTGVMCQ